MGDSMIKGNDEIIKNNKETYEIFDNKKRLINIVIIAVLAALAISLSYVFSALPNIEVMSFLIFISGFLYGTLVGTGVGFMAPLIYYGWNPYGPADIPTYLTCVICMAFFGIVGGLLKPNLKNKGNNNNSYNKSSNNGYNNSNGKILYSKWNILKFGIIGIALTLQFDFITNLIIAYMWYGGNILAPYLNPWTFIFLIIHIVSNTIIFALLTIPVYNSIRRVKKLNTF
ncbi:MAG: ECF transporter S component [Candidatus Lokiarchaeota archaeon]|nr:ECF transporter S component [Candidatus Lokiarchaeota archaeon]